MKIDVKLTNLHVWQKSIEQIKEDVDEACEVALLKVASEIKELEQENIVATTGNGTYQPTGNLRGSIEIKKIGYLSYGIAPNELIAPYAKWVEEGTGIYASDGNGRQTPWVYPIGNGQFVFTQGIRPHWFVQVTSSVYLKSGRPEQIFLTEINRHLSR
jgi:hypothetical protein